MPMQVGFPDDFTFHYITCRRIASAVIGDAVAMGEGF
jgi:hypothetical protein